MTLLLNRDDASHETSPAPAGGGRSATAHRVDTPTSEHSGHAAVARREAHFARIRLSRALSGAPLSEAAAVVDFPTTVVLDGVPVDLDVTQVPGLFAFGHHTVVGHGRFGSIDVRGRFEISVGPAFGISAATWVATDVDTGIGVTVPESLLTLLPHSVEVPATRRVALNAVRRAHLDAERARAELLAENGGLVQSVVNRFRSVLRAESALLDLGDLVAVGNQALLEVTERHFTDPDVKPVRHVAWSKLVQRAIGNALRAEIARVTGVSVEFRQLLAWYHAHPEDREAPADAVAMRMAFAAGVTRLMPLRAISERLAAEEELTRMLTTGEARYVPPGAEAAATSRRLRADGVFVISSRSSLAEIERARRFTGTAIPALDGELDQDREAHLAVLDAGYEVADLLDAVRVVVTRSGMTRIEAAVWMHRTGVLDPGGHCTELPDIAADLALGGRSEARAALRRARRKLDAWAREVGDISH
jgi:hypothetical protein